MNRATTLFSQLAFALAAMFWLTDCALATTINAASCSQSAVQTAINSAVGGDTVVVPIGSCTWTASVSISGKGIRLLGPDQGQRDHHAQRGDQPLISFTTDATP